MSGPNHVLIKYINEGKAFCINVPAKNVFLQQNKSTLHEAKTTIITKKSELLT